MTAPAVLEIVAAERALVVVTRGAARRAFGRKMHRRQGRRDLPPASRAGFDRVAARAVHRLQVPRVRKRRPVSRRRTGRARRRSRLMTRSARRQNVAGIRRVALKTARVRARARRDRKTDAAARRLMTARAVRLPHMLRVVEPRVKTS